MLRFEQSLLDGSGYSGPTRAAQLFGFVTRGIKGTIFSNTELAGGKSNIDMLKRNIDEDNDTKTAAGQPISHFAIVHVLRDESLLARTNPKTSTAITGLEIYPPLPNADENRAAEERLRDDMMAEGVVAPEVAVNL